MTSPAGHGLAGLTDHDLELFRSGRHAHLWQHFGGHLCSGGAHFRVWAPRARSVAVAGDWAEGLHDLRETADGIWEARVTGPVDGSRYTLRVTGASGVATDHVDPFGRRTELPPANVSVLVESRHRWCDADWHAARGERHTDDAPLAIYEVHLGSWRRPADQTPPTYRTVAEQLVPYCHDLGFTHVELLPVLEYPFGGSWGYQATGYFSPTSRYGTPDDLRWFVDHLHQHELGVIFDWVPAHFADDTHALARFDGEALFEYADPREGRHPDWGSLIFDYRRPEVVSFLLSSANYWVEEFHADGLRFDAVASMLYRSYSRRPGEWIPNEHGGRENLEAIAFLRACTTELREHHPGLLLIAEESSAWPAVTGSVAGGGLGFTHKWDLGWMHDTLRYLGRAPRERPLHPRDLTFRSIYEAREQWLLPLSHDEVVHEKGSLLEKVGGPTPAGFASLRLLFAFQFGLAGAKLLFMGDEFGQVREWDHDGELDWHLLGHDAHAGTQRWVAALLGLYRAEPALRSGSSGMRWLPTSGGRLAWLRTSSDGADAPRVTLWVVNPTDDALEHRLGVPLAGEWEVVLDSDAHDFGGAGRSPRALIAEPVASDEHEHSLAVTVPPLTALVARPAGAGDA